MRAASTRFFTPAQHGPDSAEDDAQLLSRIQRGNHAAFSLLVHRHAARFYRVAYRMMSDRSEAEDIVQEAFVKLWERPGLWQAERNTRFTTWFYRVVVNLCLDHHKKKRPLPLADDNMVADGGETHEETLIRLERQRSLEAAIAALPKRQRVALNLCFYEGLSNQQAADIMEVSLKGLQSLLMRAKATLKKTLYQSYGG